MYKCLHVRMCVCMYHGLVMDGVVYYNYNYAYNYVCLLCVFVAAYIKYMSA